MTGGPEPSTPEETSSDTTDARGPDSLNQALGDAAAAWPPARAKSTTPQCVRRCGAWLRTHAKLWVSGVAVVVVAIAALLVWPMLDPRDDEAESRVRVYLEAVRAKDLDKAESMLEKLGSGAEQLMTADALDTNWTIQSLASEDFQAASPSANVNAVLKARNGQEVSFQFELTRPGNDSDERFKIKNGYVGVQITEQQHEYLRINGEPVVTGEVEFLDRELWLYPGIYRFGHALEDFFDVDWQQRLLAGGSYTVDASGQDFRPSEAEDEPWSLSAAGQERAQELMDARIDGCVDKSVAIEPGCPFGAYRVPAGGEQDVHGDELDDVEWEVEEYPEVTVLEEVGRFRYVDRSPGSVRLSATGDTDAGSVEVDVECQIETTYLHLTIEDDAPVVDTIMDYSSNPVRWGTCSDALWWRWPKYAMTMRGMRRSIYRGSGAARLCGIGAFRRRAESQQSLFSTRHGPDAQLDGVYQALGGDTDESACQRVTGSHAGTRRESARRWLLRTCSCSTRNRSGTPQAE